LFTPYCLCHQAV